VDALTKKELAGMSELPGGEISSRPLRFFWVLDVSGSMAGEKIGQLNHAIREALPAMKDTADENAEAAVEVKVLTFGSGFKWVTPSPVPLDNFTWTDVSSGGVTDLGAAFRALATELSIGNMPERGLPPVVVLATDGQPTDNFEEGLSKFMAEPWAQRAVRIGIAIGHDADRDVLRKFIASEIEPLEANNSADLVQYIKWVSTQVLKAASAPPSQPTGQSSGTQTPPTVVPKPPPPSATDVW
jgi:uncharacterized protein YegL